MKKNEHTKLRINRIRNYLFLVISLSVFMMSCRQEPLAPVGTDVPMNFVARLYDQYGQSSSPIATKADDQPISTGSLTTLNGENLGIYVVRGASDVSNPLLSQANTYDNVHCPVGADGNPAPAQAMYYPTRRDYIDVYSYRPYDQNLANPNFIKWTLPTDQTDPTLVAAADFLFSKKHVAPLNDNAAQVPVNLELKHALTLVHVSVTVPSSFLDKNISAVQSPLIINTSNTARITIGDQYAEKYPQSPVAEIVPRLLDTKVDGDNKIYLYEALLVPQAVSPGNQLFRLEVAFADGTKGIFRYNVSDEAYALKSGYFQTIALVLADYGKLELTSASISDWTNQPVSGNIGGGGVGNTFEMNMIEPEFSGAFQPANIKGARMHISGTPYTFTANPPVVSGNKLITTVKVSFPSDGNTQPPDYPFLIDKIEFLGATTNVLVTYNVSIEVTSGGNVVIPLYKYAVITTNDKTTVTGWGSVLSEGTAYPDISVSNPFMLYYCDAASTTAVNCLTVTKMVLKIDNKDVTIDGFDLSKEKTSTNTIFAAISATPIVMPTINAPKSYPYTITSVQLYRGATPVLAAPQPTNIYVWTAGQVGIAVMK